MKTQLTNNNKFPEYLTQKPVKRTGINQKNVKWVLTILLLISANCYSQEYYTQGGVEWVRMPVTQYDLLRNSQIKYYVISQTQDSAIQELLQKANTEFLTALKKDSAIFVQNNLLVNNLQKEVLMLDGKLDEALKIGTPKTNILKFEGLYIGYLGEYILQDTIVKSSFWSGINNNIYVKARVTFDRFEIEPYLKFPLYKSASGIYCKIGYKVF